MILLDVPLEGIAALERLVTLITVELRHIIVDGVHVLFQPVQVEVGLWADLAGVGPALHPPQDLLLAKGGPATGWVEVHLQVLHVAEGYATGGAGPVLIF